MLASFVGPRQQGTAFNMLHHQLGNPMARCAQQALSAAASVISRKPGPRRSAIGAEIRTDAEVAKIVTKNGAAVGVVLQNGDQIDGDTVVSNADVKRTFFKLVEPTYLDPHFLLQVRNIRSRGTVAKINLALDTLPNLSSNDQRGGAGRRHSYRPDTRLSGAGRRRRQIRAILPATVSGNHHSVDRRPIPHPRESM